jgi:hypothetical protein
VLTRGLVVDLGLVLLGGSIALNAYLVMRLQVVTKERDLLEMEKRHRLKAASHLKLVRAGRLVRTDGRNAGPRSA